MNLDTLFPKKYLKANDFPKPIVVTIREVKIERMGQTNEEKGVMYFAELAKGLVLNQTNSLAISKHVGSEECRDWCGARIELFKAETDFRGEQKDCIRVRPPRKKPAPVKADYDDSDEVPDTWDDEPARA